MACAAASRAARDSLDLHDEPGSALRKSGVGPGFRLRLRRFRRFVARIERSEIRERRFGSTAAPGFRFAQPGLRRKMKEAERRQTLGNNRRILRCGARPFGARTLDGVPPRLSPKGIIPSPRLSFRPGFLGRGLNGRYPPSPVPVQGCTSHPGRNAGRHDAQAAREQAANPPAGTALAPMTRCASAPCPSMERGLYGNRNRDICQQKSDKGNGRGLPLPRGERAGVRGFGSSRKSSSVRTPSSCPSPLWGEGTQRAGCNSSSSRKRRRPGTAYSAQCHINRRRCRLAGPGAERCRHRGKTLWMKPDERYPQDISVIDPAIYCGSRSICWNFSPEHRATLSSGTEPVMKRLAVVIWFGWNFRGIAKPYRDLHQFCRRHSLIIHVNLEIAA